MAENKHWTENFRAITPILVTVAIFLLAGLRSDVSKIDDKLFKHLTNEEIHTPRSLVVSQQAFTLYQTMRDSQMADLKVGIIDIKDFLRLHDTNTKK